MVVFDRPATLFTKTIFKTIDHKRYAFCSSLILSEGASVDSNGLWKLEDFEYNTLQYGRYVELCLNDPVHTIVLKSYVESQVQLY